jgi:hypothetical protein
VIPGPAESAVTAAPTAGCNSPKGKVCWHDVTSPDRDGGMSPPRCEGCFNDVDSPSSLTKPWTPLITTLSSRSIPAGGGKHISPLQLFARQRESAPEWLDMDEETMDLEATVMAAHLRQDEDDESRSGPPLRVSPRGTFPGSASFHFASANGEGPLLREDFNDVHAQVPQAEAQQGGDECHGCGESEDEEDEEDDVMEDEEDDVMEDEEDEEDEEDDVMEDEEDDFVEDDVKEEEGVRKKKKKQTKRPKTPALSQAARRARHLASANTVHAKFTCHCKLAKANGRASCLDGFSRSQCVAWHNEFYGTETFTPPTAARKARGKEGTKLPLGANVHQHLWAVKTAASGGSDGRRYDVKEWLLDGTPVCRETWRLARGGSVRMHRNLCNSAHSTASPLTCDSTHTQTVKCWCVDWMAEPTLLGVCLCSVMLVRRGLGPADKASAKEGENVLRILKKVTDIRGVGRTAKRAFAVEWWKSQFGLWDHLPKCAACRPSQPCSLVQGRHRRPRAHAVCRSTHTVQTEAASERVLLVGASAQ